MSDASNQGTAQSRLDELYASLPQQDVEEFYASYSQWALQRRVAALEDAIASLRQQIDANSKLIQETLPSAVALATLVRLQANGVSDIELLDRMLERGEEWLDATMQRLDYCEQLEDFLSDDYENWCRHALEGAYDWIDSLRRQAEEEAAARVDLSSASPDSTKETPSEATEELVLSKLSSDETEDEVGSLEITVKRPAITRAELQSLASEHAAPTATTEQVLSETGQSSLTEAKDAGSQEPPLQEFAPPEETHLSQDGDAAIEEPVIQEFIATEEPAPAEPGAPSIVEDSAIPEHDMLQQLSTKEGNDSSETDLEQDKEPVKHEEAGEDENEVVPVQAVTTDVSPAAAQPSPPQWEWTVLPETNSTENQAGTQENKPERRSNFLWRLLAKIWGR